MTFDALFNPRSVAVVGASSDPTRVGYALMSNLMAGASRTIIPVTDKFPSVMGLPTKPNILALESAVDLALIAVRAVDVPQTLRDCGTKGIKTAIIISAGFKEAGEEGIRLENEIKMIVKDNGITLLGPNCLGVLNTASDMNASFVVAKPLAGHISFLSQSGAIGTALLDWARGEGVGFAKFVSLGNEAGITDIDMMGYLADDPETHAVLMYLEKVSDGARFIECAKKITAKKPLIILRAGRSARGGAAVMSHTGSLAPDDAIFSAAAKQAGAITVDTLRDLFTFAKLLHMGIEKPVQRIVVLTNGGGPSVNAADLIDLSRSLELTEFSDETKSALRAILPPMAAVGNPIDVIGDATAKRYIESLKIITALPDVDAVLVIVTPQMMTNGGEIAQGIVEFSQKKPIIPVFMGGDALRDGVTILNENGLVNFDIPSDAIQSVDELAGGLPKIPQGEHEVRTHGVPLRMLDMSSTQALLLQYGIPLSGVLLKTREEVGGVMHTLDGTKFALKAISRDIVHKTDAGVVRINLNDKDDILRAWEDIEGGIHMKFPNAEIEGMLLQPMVLGKEIIIGMKRNPVFGPVILFGLGGIFVEVLKDVSMRIAPISRDDALAQIHEIKGIKLLEGVRGEKGVNFSEIADVLVVLSRLAIEHPEIIEIDLNPVMVSSTKITIVDARFMTA